MGMDIYNNTIRSYAKGFPPIDATGPCVGTVLQTKKLASQLHVCFKDGIQRICKVEIHILGFNS